MSQRQFILMPSKNPLERKHDNPDPLSEPRRQKMAVVFLSVFGLAIMALWAWQFSTQLTYPFKTEKVSVTETATTTDLHLKDSDNDGITDYDEINIYHTSAYLEDSDSDDIPDKQEIVSGSDPNCASGDDCGSNIAPAQTSSTTEETEIDTAALEGLVPTSEVSPATLRQLLLQNGFDQATLDKISDEDILKSYQEATNQAKSQENNQ